MKIRKGITRIVLVFGGFVVKIPKPSRVHLHFLEGCRANWAERSYWKQFRECPPYNERIIPTYFCSWFGLLQVQARASVLTRELTDAEVKDFSKLTTDTKGTNFGYYKSRLVCIDYA